eukprot:3615289-Amphidinium_carterae.7
MPRMADGLCISDKSKPSGQKWNSFKGDATVVSGVERLTMLKLAAQCNRSSVVPFASIPRSSHEPKIGRELPELKFSPPFA